MDLKPATMAPVDTNTILQVPQRVNGEMRPKKKNVVFPSSVDELPRVSHSLPLICSPYWLPGVSLLVRCTGFAAWNYATFCSRRILFSCISNSYFEWRKLPSYFILHLIRNLIFPRILFFIRRITLDFVKTGKLERIYFCTGILFVSNSRKSIHSFATNFPILIFWPLLTFFNL